MPAIQRVQPPLFVNEATDDYHLQLLSPPLQLMLELMLALLFLDLHLIWGRLNIIPVGTQLHLVHQGGSVLERLTIKSTVNNNFFHYNNE